MPRKKNPNPYEAAKKLVFSCKQGDLEAVRFWLTSSAWTEQALFYVQRISPLSTACGHGHLHIVRYLLTHPEVAKVHSEFSFKQQAVDQVLVTACLAGYMEIVRYVLTSAELTQAGLQHANIHAHHERALTNSCEAGHLEIIKYILTSTELEDHSTLTGYAFERACFRNQTKVVQYLLSAPELPKRISLHDPREQPYQLLRPSPRPSKLHTLDAIALKSFCTKGRLSMVKYLLTSPDVNPHARIDAGEDAGLIAACECGHLPIVKYLLTSPKLQYHANIHAQDDEAFLMACKFNHIDIIDYLVLEYKIDKNTRIEELLQSYPYAKALLAKRMLDESLTINQATQLRKRKI